MKAGCVAVVEVGDSADNKSVSIRFERIWISFESLAVAS